MSSIQMNNTKERQHEYCLEGGEQLNILASSVFYGIQCFLIVPTIFVNILVLRMLKRDQYSISLELKVNSVCNIVVSILSIVNQGLIKFAFPACQHLGSWYCHISTALMCVGMFRETIHSFSLSVYRYVFIVHGEKITSDKVKNLVSLWIFSAKWLSVCIFALKVVIFNEDEFVMYFTSLCRGNTEQQPRNSPNLTVFDWLTERSFYRVTNDEEKALVTNFGIVKGKLGISLKAFAIIVDVLILGAILNLLEGFLYSRVAKLMKS